MRKKMLLIEDEDDLRTLLEEYLSDNGLSVVSFGSADKALPYYQQHSGEIDLVLTDMRMPGTIDGIGFAQAVRRQGDHHQPSIVMISGFEPPPHELLEKLGITEFISKPFRISELSRLCVAKLNRP